MSCLTRARLGLLATVASAAPATAFADAPLGYLSAWGRKAGDIVPLTWWLLILSILVSVIITVLVVTGVLIRRLKVAEVRDERVSRRSDGLRWIVIGVGVSSIALLVSVVWTVAVLAQINTPWRASALTIEVTGHQWWWEARYVSDDPALVFTTANEIHIPTGQPVRFRLKSGDVIHSFWVPALDGKTDTIPGRVNETWLDATQPGIYRGQCGEFCGAQHAKMALLVIADTPQRFAQWQAAQIQAATAPVDPVVVRGQAVFINRCGACHNVRGSAAGGTVAPDLTHLMSRQTLAAGALPNTISGLSGWIANPQSAKPGTLMPTLYLSGAELGDVRAYLATLK